MTDPMFPEVPAAPTGPILKWQCPKCTYVHEAPAPPEGQKHICSCIGTMVKRVPNEVATIWTFDPTDQNMSAHMAVNSCSVMELVP
jgi:rubredoxin